MNTIVGIGAMVVAQHEDLELTALALGSCVALTVWCEVRDLAAMAHIAHPKSRPEEVEQRDVAYFADRGVDAMFKELKSRLCTPGTVPMQIGIVGGSENLGQASAGGAFAIGKRNVLAVKKRLWKYGVTPVIEDVGGIGFRTVTLSSKTGELRVSTAEKEGYRP